MGIYDRDYHRDGSYDDAPGIHFGGGRTLTTNLVIVTCGVYLVQLLAGPWVTDTFALRDNWYLQPWRVFELLTYGFLHSPNDLWHILGNMFVLWMFGREIEARYGRREFLAFYLVAIVVAGIVWTLAGLSSDRPAVVLGASGGISAVLILFAMNFPHRTVLFMMFIPMPMWMLGVLIVGWDVLRAMDHSSPVAATAHLGGALFGFLYYQRGLRLERWLVAAATSWRPRLSRKSKLRVHDPSDDDKKDDTDGDDRVDDILRKIQEHGQESLTWRERRILERASREYQKKRGE